MFKPYKYKKKYNTESDNLFTSFKSFSLSSLFSRSVISLFLIIFGVGFLFKMVLLPIAVSYAKTNDNQPIISPISDDEPTDKVASKLSTNDNFVFTELSKDQNANEIEHVSQFSKDGVVNIPEFFYITIPKLDIYDAKIKTNSLELNPKDAIGHFNGSCLPDEACNTFIFGHSTFKSVRNNYEKGDYKEIFSRLNELEYGDEFYINYKGKDYRYMVDFSKIDEPKNVDPLENPYPKSFHINSVTLFTCDPPGTTKYRLSVVGKLVD